MSEFEERLEQANAEAVKQAMRRVLAWADAHHPFDEAGDEAFNALRRSLAYLEAK